MLLSTNLVECEEWEIPNLKEDIMEGKLFSVTGGKGSSQGHIKKQRKS
jgi:hypothetical protein